MKLRRILFVALIALLLAACNFSMAEDVTPPPDYVPPSPAPTPGPLFPAQAPDAQNGGAIYAEKCADCHGITGLGDGPQGKQLPVSVPPLALPEIASSAAPADWFLAVTLGNIDKFMPPFATSLNDQERWDVVAYTQSLSSASAQISQGEGLFNDNCADCSTDFFTNQEKMAALSIDDLVSLLAVGGEGLPALGGSLSEDELGAVAVYLRTLTFAAASPTPEPAPATALSPQGEAPEPAQTESPSADETSVEGEQAAVTPEAPAAVDGFGPASGMLINGSGGAAPSGLTVTLLGFDHALDADGAPVEVVNETVESDATGAFLFEDVEISEGRIFLVETTYQGITFQSELAFSDAGMTKLTIPDITVYESTTEAGELMIEQVHISFDVAEDGSMQVREIFTISNLSGKAYISTPDGTSLPFIPLPEGVLDVGLELSQDSAPLLPTEAGFAILPSEDFYIISAVFSMPYDKKLTLSQPFTLPVSSILVIVPEGILVKSGQLVDEGLQPNEQGSNVRMYSGGGLSAGTLFEIKLSGKVKSASTTADETDNRQALLIGAGAFGMILILAGAWMFLRDRDNLDKDDYEDYKDGEVEFESAEEVMDAIIALDDLHRAKKIPDEAYQTRRAELKELLRELA